MGINSDYQITENIPIGKLTENHAKQLVPIIEVIDILVTIIFIYEFVKYALWLKLYDLGKTYFPDSLLADLQAKIINSIRTV
ncbi:hypothetical protein ES705_21393 [subsurface metagenome]